MARTDDISDENPFGHNDPVTDLLVLTSPHSPGTLIRPTSFVSSKSGDTVKLDFSGGQRLAICEVEGAMVIDDEKWECLADTLHLLARGFAMVGLECPALHVAFYAPEAYERTCELADASGRPLLTATEYQGTSSTLLRSISSECGKPFQRARDSFASTLGSRSPRESRNRNVTPDVTYYWHPAFAPDEQSLALRNEYMIAELIQETVKYLYESVQDREDSPLFNDKARLCREFAIANQRQIVEGVFDVDATGLDLPDERFDSSLQLVMTDQLSKAPGWEGPGDSVTWPDGQRDDMQDIWDLFEVLVNHPGMNSRAC